MPPRSLDPRLVTAAARDLRGDAGHHFSSRQLWYAVCARLAQPHLTQGTAQIVAGSALIAVGVLVGVFATVFVAAVVPVGMVVVGMGVQRRRLERSWPTTAPLAVSYDAFLRETLDPMSTSNGAALAGLLPADAVLDDAPGESLSTARDFDGDVTAEPALIVCDRAETAAVVARAARVAEIRWEVVDEQTAPSLAGRRCHTLHDADPGGCALPLRMAAAGAGQVVDLGLRPGQITGRRIQVIEGAPSVVDAALSALLTVDEVVWLAEGRRVELAVLTPGEIIDGLRASLAVPPVSTPGAAPTGVALAGASLVPNAVRTGEPARAPA